MDRHPLRQMLLLATVIFLGSSSALRAQPDFKGERRAPNPTVSLRPGARRTTTNEKVEMALAQGNRARDKANTVGTSDDLDLAQVFYKKALALNPKEARAYVGLGNVEMDYSYKPDADGDSAAWREGMKRAEGYYRKALELNPKYYDAYMGLGFIYYLNSKDPSNYAKSEQAYRQAISLRPRDESAYLKLAEVYEWNKDYSKAAAVYREILNFGGGKEERAAGYYLLAGVLVKQGEYAEAIGFYRKGIELDPKDAGTHGELGRVYLNNLQKYADAVQELRLAVKLSPDASAYPPLLYEAYYKLGLSYVEAKNKTAAMEQYQNLRKAGQTDYAERLLAEINKL